jgi:hypothetical protein
VGEGTVDVWGVAAAAGVRGEDMELLGQWVDVRLEES